MIQFFAWQQQPIEMGSFQILNYSSIQKHPSIGVLIKRCSENMQQICRRKLRNFIEITLRHRCSLVNLLHIFRTHFYRNTYEALLLNIYNFKDQCSTLYQKQITLTGEHSGTLLKSHFGIGVLLQICCIFLEHLFIRTHMECCF